MSSSDHNMPRWLSFTSLIVSVIGMADSMYLTVHHLTGEQVPCNLVNGCEKVLTSEYAELFGIPIAAFGLLAYFSSFSLSVLTVFGRRWAWQLFGGLSLTMAGVSTWLVYLQWSVIKAFCQFCLLSAGSSLVLLLLFLFSLPRLNQKK